MNTRTSPSVLIRFVVLSGVLWASAAAAAPVRFEPNHGQSSSEVAFLARGGASSLFLTQDAAHVRVGDRVVVLGFGEAAVPYGVHPLPGRVHYLRGTDASRWVRDVPGFAAVRYPSLAPGVDLTFVEGPGGLGLRLDLAPGADLDALRWTLRGADALTGATDGGVLVALGAETVRVPPPTLVRDGVAVSGRFRIDGTRLHVEEVPAYEALAAQTVGRKGLLLSYTTFLGGSGDEVGAGITVDADGAAYVVGHTSSPDFPATDAMPGEGPDVFISKLAPDGTTLVFSVVIGGVEADIGHGIALAGDGSVLVTGETGSPDFPVTVGAFDTDPAEGPDGFVIKLSPDGSDVLYSTFLGGDGADVARGVGVDAMGAAYVTGFTTSTDFPVTPGVVMPDPSGGFDVFAAKLSTMGDALVFGTYIGGTLDEFAYDLAVREGEMYVTGETISADLPTSPGVLGPTFSGLIDVFVAHLSADAASMELTYLGGSDEELGEGIAVDATGSVYVGGIASTFFPVTPSAAFSDPAGGPEAFLAVLAADLSVIDYATYYGGGDLDFGCDVALDDGGLPVLVGKTNSVDLPVTDDAPQPAFGGITDGFYARFDHTAFGIDSFLDGTYIGGSSPDIAHAVAVGADGLAYVTGFAESSDFPTTPGTFSEAFNGGMLDAFVARFPADFETPVATAPDPSVGLRLSVPSPNPLGRRTTLTLTSDRARYVRAEVIDRLGRVVSTVWDGAVSVGATVLSVDAGTLPSGTYSVRVMGDGFAAARSLTVRK